MGVSVVGKYRYLMASPAENDRVPVVVDIILVGALPAVHAGAVLGFCGG